jgi:hypothetical protein
MSHFDRADLEDLKKAKALLENPGLAARITDALGTPIEKGFSLLPTGWSDRIRTATQKALQQALHVALGTMAGKPTRRSSDAWHRISAAASGGLGGAFGLPALAVELPISTVIMLRSIADIARSHGEDLGALETRLACLEVFALGGKSAGDDATDGGYFVIRAALAKAVSEAAEYVAERGIARESAPALVRLIAVISSRFGIVVSQKAAAIAVPAIGAVGGAVINTLFMDHFQNMAHGHFTVRRLERKYGNDVVRTAYLAVECKVDNGASRRG